MKAVQAVRGGLQKDFVRKFEALSGRYSIRQIWEDWVVMTAIAISNTVDQVHASKREQHYMTLAKKYSAQELAVFTELLRDMVSALEVNPDQDFLGDMFMALGLGNDHAGQFFTPYSVCKAMAKITAPDIQGEVQKRGWISVNDPACGAGALLVAFANECLLQKVNYQTSVLFTAQDIDYLVGCMCYLQLSLLGCPGYVKIGNTLTDPSTCYDDRGLLPRDDGNIWYTPFYFLRDWHVRRVAATLALISSTGVPAREVQENAGKAHFGPLQPPPACKAAHAPVAISSTPTRPVEAEEMAYKSNEAGQLTLF